jgi:hypothetical protein
MKFTTAVLSALAISLGGCAVHVGHRYEPDHGGMHPRGPADVRNPRVGLRGGKPFVDQEVLRFGKADTNVLITWRLPPGSKLRFPDNGIVFERAAEGEIVDCKPSPSRLEFSCVNRHTRRDYFKYDIRLLDDDKPVTPLDPYVVND